MCKLWAFFFFTGKVNNLARFQFFKCLIPSKGWVPQAQAHLMGHQGEESQDECTRRGQNLLRQSLTQAKGQGGTSTRFWGAESAATQDSFLDV